MRRIHTIDVERRIGLGITQRLSIAQHVGEVRSFGFHPSQDIIARAVQDAIDFSQDIGGSPLAQPLDHRDPPGNRGFIFQRRAFGFGVGREPDPVVRDHRLVRRDERFARRNRSARQLQRWPVCATDQFDDDIDIAARRQRLRVIDPVETRQIDSTVAVTVTGIYGDDLDRPSRTSRDQLPVGVEQFDDTAAHSAQPGERDFQWFVHARRYLQQAYLAQALLQIIVRCNRFGVIVGSFGTDALGQCPDREIGRQMKEERH